MVCLLAVAPLIRPVLEDVIVTSTANLPEIRIGSDGNRTAFGIHAYGGARNNSATRITTPVFQNLSNWLQA